MRQKGGKPSMPENRRLTGGNSHRAHTKKADRRNPLRTGKPSPKNRGRRNSKRRIASPRSEQREKQLRRVLGRSRKGGRRRLTQNSGETERNRPLRKLKKADRGLLRRQRHFILEKLVGKSDKDAALAAGYSLWIATNTKQKIWAKPGVREEYERLKSDIVEIYYDRLRSAINGTSASLATGARKEVPLDSTSIAP